jgi:hypothetical protein
MCHSVSGGSDSSGHFLGTQLGTQLGPELVCLWTVVSEPGGFTYGLPAARREDHRSGFGAIGKERFSYVVFGADFSGR